ncbi:MAG TPA: glucosyl-3-phosphoglycerate synthase [Acidimicrobiales bacterium]|nr:glucosyl-3-phosphoglycerate synthase [Acidimicrobiales bacterium]
MPVALLHHADFSPEALVASKRDRTVTVCLPARDEAATVGAIVACVHDELVARHPLVDEVLVVDDGSRDGTAAVARAGGARVVATGGVGKGRAMWTGLREAQGDVVVFCDADVENFASFFVTGLVGPLLVDESIAFVKGSYGRPLNGRPGQGGRVTELMAKPLLRALFPHLGGVDQPLGGECAGRRRVLGKVPFVEGYGVDVGLVLDVAAMYGVGSMAQVDLGERRHRNRPLEELAGPAEEVMNVVLARAGIRPAVAQCPPILSTRAPAPPGAVSPA